MTAEGRGLDAGCQGAEVVNWKGLSSEHSACEARAPHSSDLNLRIAVLNPQGRDRFQDFSNGLGRAGDCGHPPVNYHAYAACTGGVFCQMVEEVQENHSPVILLLRKRLKPAVVALEKLKARGVPVVVSFKESGTHQVAALLGVKGALEMLQIISTMADGFLSSTPELVSLYKSLGITQGTYLPTPYPLDFTQWNFGVPLEKRKGIFIGTREFEVPSRNHAAALLMACDVAKRVGTFVTVLENGERGARRRYRDWQQLHPNLNIVRGPLKYDAYLELLAKHRIVFQLDRSRVPGQVAGDAALCRTLCIGGDGAIDREVFPTLSGACHLWSDAGECLENLMTSDRDYQSACDESERLGQGKISFSVIKQKLRELMAYR